MSDSDYYIRLPAHLFSEPATIVASGMHDDEHFAAHQAEFFRHLFGRCAYLRAQSRETPSADAFLSVFVNLIDLLIANAPAEAAHCMEQLHQVLALTFPKDSGCTEATPCTRPLSDDPTRVALERTPKSSGSAVQMKSAPHKSAADDPEQSGA